MLKSSEIMKNFDRIKECISCGNEIKTVKLNYIKKKIPDITVDELKFFKYCKSCKRQSKYKLFQRN